ncbi:MAG TPA: hypothetical protein VH092_17645 [Urbifossiella sp.]|nr:hypothetical protein [Urbifossiella sp.]
MREFVVTLRNGRRYTIRADRAAFLDGQTLGLVVQPNPAPGGPEAIDQAVAVFDRRLVASVIAADHLVSEGKAETIDPPWLVQRDGDPDSDIPF